MPQVIGRHTSAWVRATFRAVILAEVFLIGLLAAGMTRAACLFALLWIAALIAAVFVDP